MVFFFLAGDYASLVSEVSCNYHKITYGTYLALIGPVMNLATSFDKTRITNSKVKNYQRHALLRQIILEKNKADIKAFGASTSKR